MNEVIQLCDTKTEILGSKPCPWVMKKGIHRGKLCGDQDSKRGVAIAGNGFCKDHMKCNVNRELESEVEEISTFDLLYQAKNMAETTEFRVTEPRVIEPRVIEPESRVGDVLKSLGDLINNFGVSGNFNFTVKGRKMSIVIE